LGEGRSSKGRDNSEWGGQPSNNWYRQGEVVGEEEIRKSLGMNGDGERRVETGGTFCHDVSEILGGLCCSYNAGSGLSTYHMIMATMCAEYQLTEFSQQ
jgi:hypothetical protein